MKLAVLAAALALACASPAHAHARHAGAPSTGIASTYGAGDRTAGRPTASGETFRPGGLTAAHPSLPMGARVRVTNLRNGRSVVVRINDRGPYVRGRIIDLSTAAARAIGLNGLGRVRVTRIA